MTSYLVADIGGTHARCARATLDGAGNGVTLDNIRSYNCIDFASIDRMLDRYHTDLDAALPADVCLAVAGPVNGDRITLTNNDWNFSIEQLRRRFGLDRLSVINDLGAVAHATRYIGDADKLRVRAGRSNGSAPRVVIGAGTGLGVAALTRIGNDWHAIACEAGHAAFVPAGKKQQQVQTFLQERHGHVSWETVLSGPALTELHQALAAVNGRTAQPLQPREITARACAGEDALCVETAALFCSATARFAGDAALWFCAFGGVFLSGHIFGSLRAWLSDGEFLEHFSRKGVMTPLLETVPVSLILPEHPGLIGAAAYAHGLATRDVLGAATEPLTHS